MSEETYPNCDYGPPGSGRPGGRDPPRASRDLPSESAANPSGPAVNEASNMTGQTTAPVGGGIYVIHPGVLPIPVRRASGGPSLVTGTLPPPITLPARNLPVPIMRMPAAANIQRHQDTPHPAVLSPRVEASSTSGLLQGSSSAPQDTNGTSLPGGVGLHRPNSSPTPQPGTLARAHLRSLRRNNHGRDDLTTNGAQNSGPHPRGGLRAGNAPNNNSPQSHGVVGASTSQQRNTRTNRTSPDLNAVLNELRAQHQVQLNEVIRDRDGYRHAFEGLRERLDSLEGENRILESELNGTRSQLYSLSDPSSNQHPHGTVPPPPGDVALQRALTDSQRSHVPGVSHLKLGGPYMLLAQTSTPGAVDSDSVDFAASFRHLFMEVQRWACIYASYTRNINYETGPAVPESLKMEFANMSSPITWPQMLSSQSTRWALITKLIVHHLVTEVMSIRLVMDFNPDWDLLIYNAMDQQLPYNHEYSAQIARMVQFLIDQPSGLVQLGFKFRRVMGELKDRFRYLLSPFAIERDAYQSLETIVNLAFRLGLVMHGCSAQWHIIFPPSGTPFRPYDQIPRDESGRPIRLNPIQAVDETRRVKLSFTPTILKEDLHHHTRMVTTMHVAEVLLME